MKQNKQMKTNILTYSLLVAQICAESSQTKAESWVWLDDDECQDYKCDIVMAGEQLKAFASSCRNMDYDPLLDVRDLDNNLTKNYA
jgi:hypothetical protein